MSSAADVNLREASGTTGQPAPKTARPNPVALEAQVSVTGARPATAQDKRELFTEETNTVLVFKDGAVIQLSAAVTVGQLLFLTEKKTKREVVCQVVHKRNYRPTSCYVEVEFTEDAPDFWGVSFPTQEESAKVPPVAEAVEAEEVIEDEANGLVEAPKSEDVAQLRDEVEALRAQLRELKEKQAAEEKKLSEAPKVEDEKEASARRLAEAELAARAAAEAEAKQRAEEEAKKKAARLAAADALEEAQKQARAAEAEKAGFAPEVAPMAPPPQAPAPANLYEKVDVNQQTPEPVKPPEPPPVIPQTAAPVVEAPKVEAAPQRIGMKLPSFSSAAPVAGNPGIPPISSTLPASAQKEEIDPLEDLLPKPALDFSNAPKGLDPNDPYNIYKPMRKKAGIKEVAAAAVLVVLLVGGGVFAWYKNKLPFFHRTAVTNTAAKAQVAAKPMTAAAASPANPAAAASASANASGAGDGVPATATGGAAPATGSSGSAAAANAPASAPANAPGNATTSVQPSSDAKPDAAGVKSEVVAVQPEDTGKSAKSAAGETKTASIKNSSSKGAPAKNASAKSGKNHGKAETSGQSAPAPSEAETIPADAPVLPAKLLKSIPPVYPPDAMRNYITGDVKLEAEVDAQGHVGAMKVLVGPAPLRQAAMDALKQYEYTPATQGGKAVASKVEVTIKFWFDP